MKSQQAPYPRPYTHPYKLSPEWLTQQRNERIYVRTIAERQSKTILIPYHWIIPPDKE